ncbi:MAG: hypothetical protein V1664_00055 [Candidatus Uhrbacteria bacterium]
MSTISVPLTQTLELFIERTVKRGVASTKAEVVRQALSCYAEEEAVVAVLRAQQERKDGKEIRGNLRKILKQM